MAGVTSKSARRSKIRVSPIRNEKYSVGLKLPTRPLQKPRAGFKTPYEAAPKTQGQDERGEDDGTAVTTQRPLHRPERRTTSLCLTGIPHEQVNRIVHEQPQGNPSNHRRRGRERNAAPSHQAEDHDGRQ